jgi:hypothetical protein
MACLKVSVNWVWDSREMWCANDLSQGVGAWRLVGFFCLFHFSVVEWVASIPREMGHFIMTSVQKLFQNFLVTYLDLRSKSRETLETFPSTLTFNIDQLSREFVTIKLSVTWWPVGPPLSPLLCSLIHYFVLSLKSSNIGPSWKTQHGIPKLGMSICFFSPTDCSPLVYAMGVKKLFFLVAKYHQISTSKEQLLPPSLKRKLFFRANLSKG